MVRSLLTAKLYLSILFTFSVIVITHATHNRAGEITYVQHPTKQLTVIATITTYTQNSSVMADRDTLEICWGDGSCEWISRSNGDDADNNGYLDGVNLGDDIRYNTYTKEHTYPGPSHYVIYMQDPNRNGGILNVNFPNSEGVEFFLQTTVTLQGGQFQGSNNSPVLLQPPIDIGCVGKRFIHNPNAYDVDGDSLVYKLITPLSDLNIQVPNYQFPENIMPGVNNIHFLNPVTGDFIWESPQEAGEYNIAMQIIEYRNGTPIDTLIRDMQILIEECENEPPMIETIVDTCVVAGDVLEFAVIATDPDINPVQQLKLTALGGPFEVMPNPATFEVPPGGPDVYQDHPLVGTFRWETQCEHISDQFYSVVFKAVDDFNGTTGLATLKTVRIKVVGPPPEDVQAEASTDSIVVSWAKPYFCENAQDNYFRGFSVWRRENSNLFPLDVCEPGLEGQGYTRLIVDTKEMENGRYTFTDLDVERGRTYCYRILGEFAKTTVSGFAFNRVQSLPSDEICIQLGRDIPLITNVDVMTTSNTNGEIEVRWTKPLAEDLDTLLNPGPYIYELWRAEGIVQAGLQPVLGASFTSSSFANANDTVFIDTGLNTVDNAYTYQIAFYVNGENTPLGETAPASSVYLTVAPTDEANQLSWSEDVPWDNFEYTIYRRDPGSTTFNPIATTDIPEYLDEGLINGEEYCYYIESMGSYGVTGVMTPLLNKSQEVCSIPEDNVPPCPPILIVSNSCEDASNTEPEEAFFNTLSWTNPNNLCEDTDDVASYNIYYAAVEGEQLEWIAVIDGANDTTFIDQPELGVAGCYAVTSVDFVGNESPFSNIVCIDNCPVYTLPNVFTPNGDNANDLFIPFPYRFIDRIDLKIYNRWGNLIYETTNPDINWNGTNLRGEAVAEGTYFYSCNVFERRSSGIVESIDVLSGYIELVRGN